MRCHHFDYELIQFSQKFIKCKLYFFPHIFQLLYSNLLYVLYSETSLFLSAAETLSFGYARMPIPRERKIGVPFAPLRTQRSRRTTNKTVDDIRMNNTNTNNNTSETSNEKKRQQSMKTAGGSISTDGEKVNNNNNNNNISVDLFSKFMMS
jgi:hypothetical protein